MHNIFNKIFFFLKLKLSHLLRGKKTLKHYTTVMYFVLKNKIGKNMFNSGGRCLLKQILFGSCKSKYQEDKVVAP